MTDRRRMKGLPAHEGEMDDVSKVLLLAAEMFLYDI